MCRAQRAEACSSIRSYHIQQRIIQVFISQSILLQFSCHSCLVSACCPGQDRVKHLDQCLQHSLYTFISCPISTRLKLSRQGQKSWEKRTGYSRREQQWYLAHCSYLDTALQQQNQWISLLRMQSAAAYAQHSSA